MGMWAVLTAVLVAAFGSRGSSPNARREASSGTAASGPAASVAGDRASAGVPRDHRMPYLEFWGRSTLGDSDRHSDLGDLIAADGDRVAAEFLIVTVPDPLDTRLGYRFDAALDAVQMAVESQRWNLDRSWLPWCPAGRQLTARSDLKPVIDAATQLPLHETQPGVLMFRKPRMPEDTRRSQRLLFVLMVGESPTTGVAKQPLVKCLEIIRSYHRRRGSDERLQCVSDGLDRFVIEPVAAGMLGPKPLGRILIALPSVLKSLVALNTLDIRIVGPMFSGSQQSLAQVLSGWFGEHAADPWWRSCYALVRVRSGNALTIAKEQFGASPRPGHAGRRLGSDSIRRSSPRSW